MQTDRRITRGGVHDVNSTQKCDSDERTAAELLDKCLQAFLELGTEEAAITMVNYYTAVTPQV